MTLFFSVYIPIISFVLFFHLFWTHFHFHFHFHFHTYSFPSLSSVHTHTFLYFHSYTYHIYYSRLNGLSWTFFSSSLQLTHTANNVHIVAHSHRH